MPNKDDPENNSGHEFDDIDKVALGAIFATKGIQEISEQLEDDNTLEREEDSQNHIGDKDFLNQLHSHPILVLGTIIMAAIMAVNFIRSDPSPDAIFGVIAFISLFGVVYLFISEKV